MSQKVLFVLDPSIIQESATKIALIKKLLGYAYPTCLVDQYNINLIFLREKQQNVAYDSYSYVYYLNSSNFAEILSFLLGQVKIDDLPTEVQQLCKDYRHEEASTAYEISDEVLKTLYRLMKPDGKFYMTNDALTLNGIMAGFLADGKFWVKPNNQAVSIPLKKKSPTSNSTANANPLKLKFSKFKKATTTVPAAAKEITDLRNKLQFFDSNDDLIDENDLLDELALSAPIKLTSVKCVFDDDGLPVKRRKKACKNCSCGLKELEEQEIEAQEAERNKNAVKLTSQEITEIDFTVEGDKVGGCGSCALGDAFRCDGCPYLGLPAFKPGQAISISGMDDDF
ncbi:electron carrier [Saccharomycopsis crataegensis]|uniref:Electron carrier n=1 Tax=Saccharomycopsis crataegensis TaxID=43959 RepID=A0AAV5QUH2_9ASCO|nr:electron carrier [Saccharomycopsis crataegensis]